MLTLRHILLLILILFGAQRPYSQTFVFLEFNCKSLTQSQAEKLIENETSMADAKEKIDKYFFTDQGDHYQLICKTCADLHFAIVEKKKKLTSGGGRSFKTKSGKIRSISALKTILQGGITTVGDTLVIPIVDMVDQRKLNKLAFYFCHVERPNNIKKAAVENEGHEILIPLKELNSSDTISTIKIYSQEASLSDSLPSTADSLASFVDGSITIFHVSAADLNEMRSLANKVLQLDANKLLSEQVCQEFLEHRYPDSYIFGLSRWLELNLSGK